MLRVSRQLMNRSAFTQHINHTIGSELSGTAYERLFLIYQLIHGAESGQWHVLSMICLNLISNLSCLARAGARETPPLSLQHKYRYRTVTDMPGGGSDRQKARRAGSGQHGAILF